jgi:HEPN domain-containing protein
LREEARLWLDQARTDRSTAKTLLDQGVFYASVFFSQQAAEKALKALWVVRKRELAPGTHNLVEISEALGAPDQITEAAAELAPEFILTRYPTPDVSAPVRLYTRHSAEVHLAAADAILEWVTPQMEWEGR